jgi:hypothetical protein
MLSQRRQGLEQLADSATDNVLDVRNVLYSDYSCCIGMTAAVFAVAQRSSGQRWTAHDSRVQRECTPSSSGWEFPLEGVLEMDTQGIDMAKRAV